MSGDDLLVEMKQKDFRDLFNGRFVTKDEMSMFATKEELRRVAKEAGDHSTKIIRDAVSETVKQVVPDVVKGVFITVGIDPENPTAMQDMMADLRKMIKTNNDDKNSFRGSAIKAFTTGAISIFFSGIVIYIAKAANIIK